MQTPANPELPIIQGPEQSPANTNAQEMLPDISGLKKDENAIEQALEESEAEGRQHGVLTEKPLEGAPIPTAENYKRFKEKDTVFLETEKILQAPLWQTHKDKPPTGLFTQLPENIQPLIKEKGEETADLIAGLIRKNPGKLNFDEVYNLIYNWIALIPDTNKFFLEQEAKSLTDDVLIYAEQLSRDPNLQQAA